jgi:CheY-like chemotaxis protein
MPVSLGQLPLAGKSVLIIEDNALIAVSVESCLQDAGAAVVIANSIALAQSALDEAIPFDAAVVDLLLTDGNASPLIQVLSERGIPVVISTGDEVDRGQPALSKAVACYGYRRTTALLRNADWVVNFKRVERIWRREVLKVPAKQPKRKPLWLKSEFMHQRFPAIVRCPQLV